MIRPCQKCGGKGSIRTVTFCRDPQCGDSTWDHECGDDERVDRCNACEGSGVEGLTWANYQREVARTGSCVPRDDEARVMRELSLCGMGVSGEAGEVTDLLKKVVHHGRPFDDVRSKLILEMGDVLWYLAHLANVIGVDLGDVAQANIDKLRARFPQGFTREDSVAKRDEKGSAT